MIIRRITQLGLHQQPLICNIIVAHSRTCVPSKRPVCPGSGGRAGGGGGGSAGSSGLVRNERSGKCRFGFLPEEWFLFFSTKTGVSGPYFLLLGIVNYACSKEIYVMEHEYYSGLSIALILYLLSTRMGREIGAALDKDVDAFEASVQKGRNDEMALYQNAIKQCELAIAQAQGQKELMAAKKENIQFQLEAAYRERVMQVYNAVKGRMLYHIRRNRVVTRIHQRWMIEWVLKNVRQSITPDFQKAALKSAISDLTAMASKS